MKKKNWQGAIISILFAELVGVMSSLFSGNIKEDYMNYIKPMFAPPDWLFGVVWPILYALMGLAAFLVYKSDAEIKVKIKALTFYFLQLVFNFLWPIVFFGFNLTWGGVLVICILDILVIITTYLFYQINKVAGNLMVPYLLWILFATYLNIGIALLN